MRVRGVRWAVSIVPAIMLYTASASAQAPGALGNPDTFEGGTQGWLINLLGMGSPPPQTIPQSVPGGPTGNFLMLTSVGVEGAGGRLTTINFMNQWAGNYLSNGIAGIRLDARNFGNTDVHLRLQFENPLFGPPTDIAISGAPHILAAGSGWTSLFFPLFGPGGLIPLAGDVSTVLSNTTALRIYHSPDVAPFGPPVNAQIGIDNISIAVVPEPATVALLALGLVPVFVAARRRVRRQ